MSELTEKEEEVLIEVLDAFEEQFDGGVGELFSFDDEWVDIQIDFDDDSYEQFKLERALLSSGKPIKDIADSIN